MNPSRVPEIRIAVVTPVRDEELYVAKTIESVLGQTVQPVEWIFVDDNSTDRTASIIERYLDEHRFIRLVKLPSGTSRLPGSGVVRAFNFGIRKLETMDVNIIMKLDADLTFESDLFEGMADEFRRDDKLGIASGMIYENRNGQLVPVKKNHESHPYGAAKFYKKSCFDLIWPLDEIKGWDLVDNIKANMKGFKTRIIHSQRIIHQKLMESAAGKRKENYLKGYYSAHLRYLHVFTLLRAVRIALDKPYILGAVQFLAGYFHNLLAARDFYPDASVTSFLRQQQRNRILRPWKGSEAL